jgi:DNA-binding LacI/PurR family transcriptional regulator
MSKTKRRGTRPETGSAAGRRRSGSNQKLTISDIARLENVSKKTVSRVINRSGRAGLRIPEDLSIVGFDDSPIATRIWPTLTTVRLPIVHMGRIATQLLISNHDRLAMEPPSATR